MTHARISCSDGHSGQKVVALIETTALVCVERFSDYPQLGRFTLRDEGWPWLLLCYSQLTNHPSTGRTIAIGKVSITLSPRASSDDTSQITKLVEHSVEEVAEGVSGLTV
jgi:hypothetical protein